MSNLCEASGYFAVKSVVDRLIAALLMLVVLPLMALIALAIVLCDGRPVFYRQTRVGRHGRIFRIWKFRTMCRHAESTTGVVWSSEGDPRVTALGHWLRCSHLDELPQFFNVLLGDMNLIGPRPERPEFVRELLLALPCYVDRLSVRPGITGLAQLRFGYDQSLSDVQRKTLLDSHYVRHANLLMDANILLRTVPYVIRQVILKFGAVRKTQPTVGACGLVASPTGNVSHRRRRRGSAMPIELKPHIALLPDPSAEFRAGHAGSGPWSDPFIMDVSATQGGRN